jgi:hypothetical protein
MYKCSLCDELFDAIPPGAIPVGRQIYGNLTMVFPDARVHNLKVIKEEIPEVQKEK